MTPRGRLTSLLAPVLLAVVALLALTPGGIVVPETWIASVDSHDAPCYDQPISYAAAERGPRDLAYDQDFAEDNPSDGAVARASDPETQAIYDYGYTVLLVQTDIAAATTNKPAPAYNGNPSALQRWCIAAESAGIVRPIGPGSEKAWRVLNRVDVKGAPLPGYKGGRAFENTQGRLPETPGVNYREWDGNPYVKGVNRGPERIVTGSDGPAITTTPS